MDNRDGKIVIGQITKDGDTKVRVRTLDDLDGLFFYDPSSIWKRERVWNVFTYTRRKNMPEGTYLFKVREIRKDRNGYENAVVDPVITLRVRAGKKLSEYIDTISFLCTAGQMAEIYPKGEIRKRHAAREIFTMSKVRDRFCDAKDGELADIVLNEMLKKKMDLDQAHELLHEEPMHREWRISEWEKRIWNVRDAYSKGKLGELGFPLTEKKMKRKIEKEESVSILIDGIDMSTPCKRRNLIEDYLEKTDEAYVSLAHDGLVDKIDAGSSETDLLHRCEAVAAYYEEKKKNKKEEKRKRTKS